MNAVGSIALWVAFASVLVTVIAGAVGAFKHNPRIIQLSEYGTYLTAIALTLAVGALQLALITLDYSLQYVADYTSNGLSLLYRVGSMWAGQGGSLLLWAWLVSLCAAYITYMNHLKNWGISAYTTAVFASVTGLFTGLALFFANPFISATQTFVDGVGLNPLLQDPLQIIHPLTLYAGYVLYTVPFAILAGALLAGKTEGPWIKIANRWNVLAWIALTLGIVLGARWAYAELGWGGYWGWDPVENASLLPWLTGTAVMHSGLVQRGTQKLRLTAVILTMVTFLLCLFGTFLTRSGVVSSVHAFGDSNMGTVLGIAIGVFTVACGVLVVWRLPDLKAAASSKRQRGWMGQAILGILLVVITVAVLWGTLFPLFNRVLSGQEIAVTPGFFRVVITPLGLAILGLFAVSPLLPGQRVANFAREIWLRVIVAVAVFGGIMLVSHGENPGVGIVLALVVLSLMTVWKKAQPRLKDAYDNDEPRWLGVIRASGPYIGHVGLVVMLAAVTLNTAYQTQGQGLAKVGQTVTIGTQTVRLDKVNITEDADKQSFFADVAVLDGNGGVKGIASPSLVQFSNQEQLHVDVGILPTLAQDIYIVVDSADGTPGAENATLTVYTNPAVMWIWFGGALLVMGGCLFLIPRRRKVITENKEEDDMTDNPNADLDALLAAAIEAAKTPDAPMSDPVADLLAKANELTAKDGESSQDDVVAFLEAAKGRLHENDVAPAPAPKPKAEMKKASPTPPRQNDDPMPAGSPKKAILIVGGIIGALALMFGAYAMGHSNTAAVPPVSGTPTNVDGSAAPSGAAAVDQGEVSALMEKIKTNPNDSAALLRLGDIYFNAKDFENAKTFYEKTTVVTPKDDAAWVALGAAAFNQGDNATAKTAWTQAVTLNPKNAEAHYDLGFLYLSDTPPNNAKAIEEWNTVIAIDPTSELAKTVTSHIESLNKAASASPSAPAGSAAPSQGPSSPAASAAPTGSTTP